MLLRRHYSHTSSKRHRTWSDRPPHRERTGLWPVRRKHRRARPEVFKHPPDLDGVQETEPQTPLTTRGRAPPTAVAARHQRNGAEELWVGVRTEEGGDEALHAPCGVSGALCTSGLCARCWAPGKRALRLVPPALPDHQSPPWGRPAPQHFEGLRRDEEAASLGREPSRAQAPFPTHGA